MFIKYSYKHKATNNRAQITRVMLRSESKKAAHFPVIARKQYTFVYKNEKGQICDENGILLSKDLEHRVFEVIKGGKQDN